MKRHLLIILILISSILFAQTPQAFKYQAVIRNNTGAVLVNQMVSLQISILQDSPLGDMVYVETHQIVTNEYGIANINIGDGTITTGIFTDIAWGSTTHFVKTELDITGNQQYDFIGTSQLLSVPYAMYAEKSGNAEDDYDKDSLNEIQDLSLNGNVLTITENGQATQIDLSQYLDNTDEQSLQLDGNEISITNGNSIILPPDSDADTLNEIQILSKTDSTIFLSNNGGSVIDADKQELQLNGNTLTISNGNSVTFAGEVDLDDDPLNEMQFLSISNDTIYLSDAGFVVLPTNNDNDSFNEIQILSYLNDTLFLTDGGFVVMPENIDNDNLNEIQSLHIQNDTLSISSSNFIKLPFLKKESVSVENYYTFIVPSRYLYAEIELWGAGGGGSGSDAFRRGGSSGAYVKLFVNLSETDTLSLSIGQGGSYDGGNTSFRRNNILIATAGGGERGDNSSIEGRGTIYIGDGIIINGKIGHSSIVPYSNTYPQSVAIGATGYCSIGDGGDSRYSPVSQTSYDAEDGENGLAIITFYYY